MKHGCPSGGELQNRRAVMPESIPGLKLTANDGSCADFQVGQINFFDRFGIFRFAPCFQVKLNRFLQIPPGGSQRFALRGHGKIKAASNEILAIALKNSVNGSHAVTLAVIDGLCNPSETKRWKLIGILFPSQG
jgi:hypothetical protein